MKCILITRNPTVEEAQIIVPKFLKDKLSSYSLQYISPEKEKNKVKEEYSIAQIKNITSKFFRKTSDSEVEKILVICEGNKIPPISQNAFLKTLEEASGSILILSDNIENLLPTIRSRCEVYILDSIREDISNVDLTEINLDNLNYFSKMDRESLKLILKEKVKHLKDYEVIIQYEEAIKKLAANCKHEAVLLELIKYSL